MRPAGSLRCQGTPPPTAPRRVGERLEPGVARRLPAREKGGAWRLPGAMKEGIDLLDGDRPW